MKRLLFAFILSLPFVGVAQNLQEQFNAANKAYEDGKFKEAIALYHSIEATHSSAELYYNLGNSYYQVDSIAPAILYLEKSIKLNPTEDAEFNLAICNQKITDRIEGKKELVINTWWEEFRSLLSVDGWAWLSIIALLLAAFGWIIYQRVKTVAGKAGFTAGILLSGLSLLFFLMASHVNSVNTNAQEAIIFAANIDVKSSPSESGKTLFVLHKGTKVELREKQNDWQEIILADGKLGWIPSKELKAI